MSFINLLWTFLWQYFSVVPHNAVPWSEVTTWYWAELDPMMDFVVTVHNFFLKLSLLLILATWRFLEFSSSFENMEDSEIVGQLCCRVGDAAPRGMLLHITSVTTHHGLTYPSLVWHSFHSTRNIASRNIYISLGVCPQLFSSYIFLEVENYWLKEYTKRGSNLHFH